MAYFCVCGGRSGGRQGLFSGSRVWVICRGGWFGHGRSVPFLFGGGGWLLNRPGHPACCLGLVELWVCGYFWQWFGTPGELIEILIFHEAGNFYYYYFCVVDVASAIGSGFFPYFIDLALCDNSGAFFYEAVCGARGACIFCDDHDDAPFSAG